MSAYIYSGAHTGESEALELALYNYEQVFGLCPSGDYEGTGIYDQPNPNIAINPTGSGYDVYSGTTSGTEWLEVRITPSLNPSYSPTIVGVGCTQKGAYNDFLLASGQARGGVVGCPICLGSGDLEASGEVRLPSQSSYMIDFKWEIEHMAHEYNEQSIPPPNEDWCVDGEAECDSSDCPDMAVLSGWVTSHSGTVSTELVSGWDAMSLATHTYSGSVPSWDSSYSTYPDILITPEFSSGGIPEEGGDRWYLEMMFANMPTIHNSSGAWAAPWYFLLGTYFNSGSEGNCLEPVNTGISSESLVGCFGADHGLNHPSGSSPPYDDMVAVVTWRAKAYDVSISRVGDNGSNIFPNPDIHLYVASGEFVNPSICDAYKYFHFYDCLDIQSIQSGSSLDNCQVLEALEAAPESGFRVKMPSSDWDIVMTGSNWLGSQTGNPNGTSDDCTISSLGSGIVFAYVSFGDGVCGALIQRNDDSGNWSGLGVTYSLGTWSGLTYIDNQGCSGCFSVTGSGNKPPVGILTGCSGYNACVDASGFFAGC